MPDLIAILSAFFFMAGVISASTTIQIFACFMMLAAIWLKTEREE